MKTLPAAIAVLLLFSSAVYAARVAHPYTVEVPVASQSPDARTPAERAALLLVLERLSGQRLDGNPRISNALNTAENYVAQFSYVQDEAVVQDQTVNSDTNTVPISTALKNTAQWRLQIGFVPSAVDALLRDAGIAPWSLDRPQVMLLALDDQNHWLSTDDEHYANAMVVWQQWSQARGVPLLLPKTANADVTVLANTQSLDAATLMPQATQQGADALLLGNVRGSDAKGWQGQWVLRFKDQDQSFQEHASTLSALADAVLRRAAELLSASYHNSAVADVPAQLRLQVDNVHSYAAFVQLRQYLSQLDAVQRIVSTQINGTTVMLDVDVKGCDSFRSLLALFKSMQWQEEVLPPQGSDTSVKTVWRYRWVDEAK